MRGRIGVCARTLALVGVLVAGMAEPGQADYYKYYQLNNNTGVAQSSAQAVLNGLEIITETWASRSGWAPATIGYAVVGGVFCTTVTYDGVALPADTYTRVLWRTPDASCRLRDLRWGDGQVIFAAQRGGVPGGGMTFYDYPSPGNDPTGVRYYTVTLMAIDMAGNLSEPYDELVVFVHHDMDDMG